MYVHNDAKLIYLANPRTASTSTATALMEIGFEKVGKHHEAYAGMPKSWTTFAVVRNHWDAALSWVLAHNFPMSVESLERALDNEYITEHEMWAYHKPDIVMKYENLDIDLPLVLFGANLEMVSFPKENVSANRNGKHYHEFYIDEIGKGIARDYIDNRFKAEIEELGYEY